MGRSQGEAPRIKPEAEARNRRLKPMRAARVACLLWLLASCGRGPKHLSGDTYSALEKAAGALQRAYEYRDAGSLLFEPRLLDVERAVSEVPRRGATGWVGVNPDWEAEQAIGVCFTELKAHRGLLDLAGLELDLKRPGRQSNVEDVVSRITDSGIQLNQCIGHLRAEYLE